MLISSKNVLQNLFLTKFSKARMPLHKHSIILFLICSAEGENNRRCMILKSDFVLE